jgi:hypothetical protein
MIIKQHKTRILIFLGLALVGMLLLAASLSRVQFKPGIPFSLGSQPFNASSGNQELGGGDIFLWLFRGFMALLVVGFVIYVIASLLSPEGRRRLLANLLLLGLILLVASLIKPPADNNSGQQTPPQSPQQPFSDLGNSQPTATFVPNTPPWLVTATSVGLAVLVTVTVVGMFWFWQRRRTEAPTTLERLEREARQAVDALQAGADVSDVVIRCYLQMSQVLQEERGIRRDIAMTPREFESLLTVRGLPSKPVERLTDLFEAARYGHQPSGAYEERIALASLNAIIDFCKGTRKPAFT